MITEIASLPMYLNRQENYLQTFSDFLSSLERDGLYVRKHMESKMIEIAQDKNSEFNHIVINFPKELSQELTPCSFYNANGWLPFAPQLSPGLPLWGFATASAALVGILVKGLSLKNPERIMREPFCKSVFEKFISAFEIFRCPKCGALTFKRESWEHEESRFTEDRIGHGLNAIARALFLSGHGAGGEWSQATKPRKKETGFTLTCTKCGYVKSVTTSVEYV